MTRLLHSSKAVTAAITVIALTFIFILYPTPENLERLVQAFLVIGGLLIASNAVEDAAEKLGTQHGVIDVVDAVEPEQTGSKLSQG